MKKMFASIWYSMPMQLFMLHFRRYQIFLVFWYILFATLGGAFMSSFGANSLYLAPEYYNTVSFFSTAIVGVAIGIFIMSWNITTFILHRKSISFLATTAQPFLKYCINNAVLPLFFLIYYFFMAVYYNYYKELKTITEILLLIAGFLSGISMATIVGFVYFFGADKTIFKTIGHNIIAANEQYKRADNSYTTKEPMQSDMSIRWFFSARLHIRKPRDIRHYSGNFLDDVFKHHHLSALVAFFIAFAFLIGIGFTSDAKLFQIPAAASISIFFALLIAVGGAFSVFLRSWSIPVVALLYVGLNYLYQNNYLDLRNKAYGLNYTTPTNWPTYSQENILQLAHVDSIKADKEQFINRLNNWKKQQQSNKPIMYIINTSGGGLRSATFTFSTLQKLDKDVFGGQLMQQCFLINGASGGMLGAAYYRELYNKSLTDSTINLQHKEYVNDVASDLLNPLFSSFISRDIIGPVQKFSFGGFEYNKDRGYAFEEKLNDNTRGYLNKTLQQYYVAEQQGKLPTMLFNSVISRDGRKLIMCTTPARFFMKALADTNKITLADADAIDFASFFRQQNAGNIRILTALRMNATFPYVLPNVWLPTQPVTDVMDAGLRDNYGQENTLRFIETFKDWLQENTSAVVIIQIRDRSQSDWDKPYESKSLASTLTKPAFLLQYNWFKLQDYYQNMQLEFLSEDYGKNLKKVCFQYIPSEKGRAASLSFHLTGAEKKEILQALSSDINRKEFKALLQIK